MRRYAPGWLLAVTLAALAPAGLAAADDAAPSPALAPPWP